MRHFPLFLDVHGRDVLVVGSGDAAARKARLLAQAGGRLRVVAEAPCDELRGIVADHAGTLIARRFEAADVRGCALVVCSTGDDDERAVSVAAQAAGIPVNVVDRPALSTFVMPAIVDRDPITVAISSAGTAPVLARSIRARIEAMLPAGLGRLALFADAFRDAVKATRRTGSARRRFWESFFAGPVANAVVEGDESWAREQMLALINRRDDGRGEAGLVQLVGAGPGDPELLTLKALRALQEADVIVYDRLVGPAVLDYARRDADRLYVGKAPGSHARTQEQINALLVEHVRRGRRVVRLKGGDPFVFGRGGEEREHLLRAGIRVEVVPGITAATGCAAALGIPLTHRDAAQALTLITGRGRDGEVVLDWPALARDRQTLAFYMGAAAAPRIARELIAHGRDSDTPAAAVANGTLPTQRVVTGRLADLKSLVDAAGDGPVLIVVGEVVRHATAWVEQNRPLAAVH